MDSNEEFFSPLCGRVTDRGRITRAPFAANNIAIKKTETSDEGVKTARIHRRASPVNGGRQEV